MEILNKWGIKTNNIKLYKEAFIHTSYSNEKNINSYERLECLGDAVLELLMTEYLFRKYPNMQEGELTKMRAGYVCEQALYEYSNYLELAKHLMLGHGEEENGGRENPSILADLFESFLGAMFIDQGINFCKKFLYDVIIPLIENGEIDIVNDYKTKLQEMMQADKKALEYILISETGPAHKKEFIIEVRVDNITYGRGVGKSKKSAEQMAAKDALDRSCK